MIDVSISDIFSQIETSFERVQTNKDFSFQLQCTITTKLDSLLSSHNYADIDSIISLCEDDKLIMNSEIARICNILIFSKEEAAFDKTYSFLSDVNNTKELMDKYLNCFFALQRINLSIDASHTQSAIEYLHSIDLSPYAIFTIVSSEYFEDYDFLLNTVLDYMSPYWTDDYIYLFYSLLINYFPTERNILRTSLFLVNLKLYREALEKLCKIEVPTEHTVQLIASIRSIINE